MIELYTAIRTQFNTSTGATLRSLSSSRMYVGRAPQHQTGEYITLSNPADEFEQSIGQDLSSSVGGEYDNRTVDFHCWTDNRSSSRAWLMANAVHSLYQNQILSMSSSWTMLHAQKISALEIEEPQDKGWQVVVSYDYRIGRRT